MLRFWKFTSFVGTVGVVLLLTAFLVGSHSCHTYPIPNGAGDNVFLTRGFVATLITDDKSAYYGLAGAACVGWQVVMTSLGLITGFFRAPDVRR